MISLVERVLTIAREKARARKIHKARPAHVRAKISRAMKGRSNFEGHKHTSSTLKKMSAARGHDDQGKVSGTHWSHPTAYKRVDVAPDRKGPTRRTKLSPAGYEKGR